MKPEGLYFQVHQNIEEHVREIRAQADRLGEQENEPLARDAALLLVRSVVLSREALDKLLTLIVQKRSRVAIARRALTGASVMRCPHCGKAENPLDVINGLCRCQEEPVRARLLSGYDTLVQLEAAAAAQAQRGTRRAARAPRSDDLPLPLGGTAAPVPQEG